LRAVVIERPGEVTHRFPLVEFERAFELMENRQGIVAKIVLEHEPAVSDM
jgi:threonine dehydrogenase-like Zn-dependent dehydrogenase